MTFILTWNAPFLEGPLGLGNLALCSILVDEVSLLLKCSKKLIMKKSLLTEQ